MEKSSSLIEAVLFGISLLVTGILLLYGLLHLVKFALL